MSKSKAVKENVVLDRLEVTYVPIDDLKPNTYNPNRESEHDFELLCRSMDTDGFTTPIVALKDGNVIVDGEHRYRAAIALGLEEVPVVFTDMTPAQARIATLRHNRAKGDEDVELAAAVLKDLARLGATDFMAQELQMDEIELANFLESVDDQDGMSIEEAEMLDGADEATLREMVEVEGGHVEEYATASVQDVVRAREARLRKDKARGDRDTSAEERSVYRLRLIYTGDEARLIKRVLGDKPIQKLLEIVEDPRFAP